MQFHYFSIGEELYIKGNNVALMSSSANAGIPLEKNTNTIPLTDPKKTT